MTDARPAGAPARAMTDLLELRAFRASPDKVDRVEFHPVQPWLAFVTRGNLVTVWDYESNEVRGPASVRRVGGGGWRRAAGAAQLCRSAGGTLWSSKGQLHWQRIRGWQRPPQPTLNPLRFPAAALKQPACTQGLCALRNCR